MVQLNGTVHDCAEGRDGVPADAKGNTSEAAASGQESTEGFADADPFNGIFDIEPDEFAQILEDAPPDPEDTSGLTSKFTGGIPRVQLADLTFETFHAKYLVPRLPVVVEDPRGVAVPLHLTPDYLQQHYGGRVVPVDFNSPSQCSTTMEGFLSCEDGSLRRAYLRNLHMAEQFPQEQIDLPQAFGPNMLCDESKVPHCPDSWRRWFELFICSPACGGFPFLHRDMCHVHACSMQIHGRKRFTLFHPDDAPFLYPNKSDGTGNRSAITDLDAEDLLQEFPAVAHAKRITVDLDPGDILFVPADWWHTARALDPRKRGPLRAGGAGAGGAAEPEDAAASARATLCVSLAASFVDEHGLHDFLDAYCEFQAAQSLVKCGAASIV